MRILLACLLFTFSTAFLAAETDPNVHIEMVNVPTLDKLSKPVRAKGESKERFLECVRALHEKRVEELFPLQKAFRLAVEERNRQLKKGEVQQNPNLVDRYDPLFLAYKDVESLKDVNDDLDAKLHSKHMSSTDTSSWLFIISIEDYKYADPVLFAHRTGEVVKSTLQKKLDIGDDHIIALFDQEATVKNIRDQLSKLVREIQRNDTIYFYYCGHGVSNESGEQLILPYDGMPDFPNNQNTIKIERMYNKFLNSKAQRTFSFVDAGFDGTTDGVPLLKGLDNPVKRSHSDGYHKRLNILNSSRAQDTSNAYFAQEYRLFSYFLLKELLSKPQSAGELFDNVRTKVREVSKGYGAQYLQEPEFFGYRELMIEN